MFVDCTKKYTEHCFEESKRKIFNKAVENSIELVHQMCTSPQYQTGHCTITLQNCINNNSHDKT